MDIPNYLWGEAVKHATYIINRIGTRSLTLQTPYEAFKGRKPNIEHLRVFGCIGYAKTESQHLRKLDDRSRMLVHLGTEPGSKGYRLLDPTRRKIVVSRDVVFDESKSWRWSNSQEESDVNSGMFVVSFEEFGNNGIREDDHVEETENEGEETEETENVGGDNFDENDDSSNTEQHEPTPLSIQPPTLRRSGRQSNKPSYLNDYIMLAELEIEKLLMTISEEPWDYNEAKEIRE